MADKHRSKIARHLGAAPTVNFFLNFFLTAILPILPSLLVAAAPQIRSVKFQKVLKTTRDELNQLIDE